MSKADGPDSDWYYGEHATGYEERRSKSSLWRREDIAVSKLLVNGPVLDAPIGTGRYIPLYKEKGLEFTGFDASKDMISVALRRADFDYEIGDITELPFADSQFGTAICSRLLNWLSPERMSKAVRELRRVSAEQILGIRFGNGTSRMVQHSEDGFLGSLEGGWADECIKVGANDYYFCHIKTPTWEDVNSQFQWQPKPAQRIADEWAKTLGAESVPLKDMSVRCEYWTGKELWKAVSDLSSVRDIMKERNITGEPKGDGPVTIAQISDKLVLLDGRHRAKKWKNSNKKRAVFILE